MDDHMKERLMDILQGKRKARSGPGGIHYPMKNRGTLGAKISAFLILGGLVLAARLAKGETVMSIFSDVGTSTTVYTWSDDNLGQFLGNSTGASPMPEGKSSFRTARTDWFGFAGWGVIYSTPPAQNFSAYNGGNLRFWIYTNTPKINVEVELANGTKHLIARLEDRPEWTSTMLNAWTHWTLPLKDTLGNNIDLSAVKSPFEITMTTGGVFYVDNVRWTKPGASNVIFNYAIKRRSDNVEVSSITWNSVTLPADWVAADQYLEVEIDPGNLRGWGMQIYTQNKHAEANPLYTGVVGTNPGGLIDTSSTSKRLPLCWRIVDKTTTSLTIVQGTDTKLYSQELGGQTSQFTCFQWMKDRNTPSIPAENTTFFVNGEDPITVWDYEGMHYAEGVRASDPLYWGKFWGAVKSPVIIYLGAKFSTAVTPRTYKTNTLRLEFFTE
jgi:hypothetical protein